MNGRTMFRTLLAVALAAPSAFAQESAKQAAQQPIPETPTVLVGNVTPSVTARIARVTPASMSHDATGGMAPSVAAGSGMARIGSRVYITQDNSNMLAVVGDDGSTAMIRLFPAIDGKDRFMKAFGNSKGKPDCESAVVLKASSKYATDLGIDKNLAKRGVIVVLGSGTTPEVKDRCAVVFPGNSPDQARVVSVQATTLFAKLRSTPVFTGPSGRVNLEGAAAVHDGKTVRLFNRGKGDDERISSSVDIVADDLLNYLARASKDPATTFDGVLSNVVRYDLGKSSKDTSVTIGDALVVPADQPGAPKGFQGELVLMTAAAEEPGDTIANAMLVIQDSGGTIRVAHLSGAPNASGLKIEGIAVVDARWIGRSPNRSMRVLLRGVVDPDAADPATPSSLVDMELTYTPEGQKK